MSVTARYLLYVRVYICDNLLLGSTTITLAIGIGIAMTNQNIKTIHRIINEKTSYIKLIIHA